ncbi:MAG: hypothetical protein H6673_00885 [Anaerolineales bacterium]|nr:hypothetical protein [Anaerolineales bacterium]
MNHWTPIRNFILGISLAPLALVLLVLLVTDTWEQQQVVGVLMLGLGLSGAGGWYFAESFLRPQVVIDDDALMDSFERFTQRLQAGDLTAQLDLPSHLTNETFLHLAGSLNAVVQSLQTAVREILTSAEGVAAKAEDILRATNEQLGMTTEQDETVMETSSTVQEVRATVTETAERAAAVAEMAQTSVDVSKAGQQAVSDTIDGMNLIRQRVESIADNILVLSEHTQQIGEIIATVSALADQSKLLALNASVEAARAGEEGKGFGVVALEVRNLAEQSRQATNQVRDILSEIQQATNSAVMVTEEGTKGVDAGVELVNRAGSSIRDLAGTIEEAAYAAVQIAASTRQQTVGVDQLMAAMNNIRNAMSQTSTTTMTVERSARELITIARKLTEFVEQYRTYG